MKTLMQAFAEDEHKPVRERIFMYAIESWARKSFRIYARSFEDQETVDRMKLDLALMSSLDGPNPLQDLLQEHMGTILQMLPEGVVIVTAEFLENVGVADFAIEAANHHAEMLVSRAAYMAKERRENEERSGD
jgi:hypothetical protein